MVSSSAKLSIIHRKRRICHEGGDSKDNVETSGNSKSNPADSTSSPKQHQLQCEECDTATKVVYRPLVSANGAYLCDKCYKLKFPATAMCDMNENKNILIRKYTEMDIRRTQYNLVTKDNKDNYTEEEECCACLEKGYYRKCCKKYYCNTCYYNQVRSCPGCGSSIHRSGVTIAKSKPKRIAVLATWGVTFYVVIMLISIIYVFFSHNLTRPETVWKGTCRGWFPKCDRPVCIDVDADNILMPTNYNFCSMYSVHKVIGRTCIVDSQLFVESNGFLGFDVCLQQDNQDSRSSPSGLDDKFEDGVYIFEDNFDYWMNDTDYSSISVMMKSARWSNMVNAKSSEICGYNDILRPYEVELSPYKDHVMFKKNAALVFSGVRNRYSETVALDVRYGGRIEFYLKLAPIVENELTTKCKSAFSGDVRLLYSLDNGTSWSIIAKYEVWKYRSFNFSLVNETIPIQAHSNHTRFRWEQPSFDSIRDYWALDDVRIFHKFEQNWRYGDWFENKRDEKWKVQQEDQCCLDMEQCPNLPNNLSLKKCDPKGNNGKSNYRIKIVDMFIITSVFICLFKKSFHDFQTWFNNNETSDSNGNTLQCSEVPAIPQHFDLEISTSWQIAAFAFINTPFILGATALTWHILNAFDYYEMRSIQTFLYLLGFGLDFWTIRSISINVIHFWPCHTLPSVKIDRSYENFKLSIGYDSIDSVDILDISCIDLFSERFYSLLVTCVFFCGFPLAMPSILLKILQLKYEVYIVILEILGCCLIFRSIVGPLWFVQIFLSMNWIFAFSGSARDEMGRSMERPSVRHVVSNAIILSIILYLVLLISFQPLHKSNLLIKILIGALVIITGSVCGALLGILRGLPVAPKIHLTTWPTEGFSFVNERFTIRPRLWARVFGGGMNSFQYITLQVKRQREFQNIISGSSKNSNEDIKQSK